MARTPKSRSSGGGRVLLLGASNLTRILGHAVGEAECLDGVEDLWIACGRGRSYGLESRTLGHGLPGIRDAALWDELRSEGPRPTRALLTDVGNDLVYGVTVDRIEAWIAELIDRIEGLGPGLARGHEGGAAEIVLCGLPLGSLERRSERTLGFWSRLFFPVRGVFPGVLMGRVRELDHALARLASERSVRFERPPSAWYGIDPIHLRHRFAGEAARRWVGPGPRVPGGCADPDREEAGSQGAYPWLSGLRLSLARPHSDRWFGRPRRRRRPWVPGPRGVRVRLY